jgi:hypothetical protein
MIFTMPTVSKQAEHLLPRESLQSQRHTEHETAAERLRLIERLFDEATHHYGGDATKLIREDRESH